MSDLRLEKLPKLPGMIAVNSGKCDIKEVINVNRWTSGEDNQFMLELMQQKGLTTVEMITHEISFRNAVSMYDMLMADRTQALGVNLIWGD